MPPVKVRGVVLRYANYREADRILTLLTAEQGKISAVARGCRKPSGRLRAACDYFVFGEWMLRPAGSGLGVTSCAVLDSFYDLRADYGALCCAFCMRDLCDAVTGDGQPNAPLFTLFVRCLGTLCHRRADAAAVRTAFEIRTMDLLGLGPSLERCVACGGAGPPAAFSVSGGGVLCGECASGGQKGVPALPGSVAVLRQLRELDFDTLPVVSVARGVARDLEGFWKDYLAWHLDRRFRTANFADRLERFAREAASALSAQARGEGSRTDPE